MAFSGTTHEAVAFSDKEDLDVQLYFDPLPSALTLGQHVRTHRTDLGIRVASFRPPLDPGWHYNEHSYHHVYTPCPDGYNMAQNDAVLTDKASAHRVWRCAVEMSETEIPHVGPVHWVAADTWVVSRSVRTSVRCGGNTGGRLYSSSVGSLCLTAPKCLSSLTPCDTRGRQICSRCWRGLPLPWGPGLPGVLVRSQLTISPFRKRGAGPEPWAPGHPTGFADAPASCPGVECDRGAVTLCPDMDAIGLGYPEAQRDQYQRLT